MNSTKEDKKTITSKIRDEWDFFMNFSKDFNSYNIFVMSIAVIVLRNNVGDNPPVVIDIMLCILALLLLIVAVGKLISITVYTPDE